MKTIKGSARHHEDEEHDGEDGHADHEEDAAEEETDAHWWQDPSNGILATAALGDALARADPERAADYRSQAERYTNRLRELDNAIAACWQDVPAAQRKLVTTHDALGYYANRYDLEVIGTVIPSLSTAGQPSAGETAELVEEIERENVQAIFAELR